MCWYCDIQDRLDKIGISHDDAREMQKGKLNTDFKELMMKFTGPNGKALLKVYLIRKGCSDE